MNFTLRTLLLVLLFSSGLEHSSNAMQQEIVSCKNIHKKELIEGIKNLPQKLKLHLISLLLQSSIFDLQLYKTFRLEDTPSSLAFSPDGENILIGLFTAPHSQLWNIKTAKAVKTFTKHSSGIDSVAYNPKGATFLTASWDKTACMWNAKTGEVIRTIKGHTDYSSAVAFSRDGERYLTGSWDTTACVWDSHTGELVTSFTGHTEKITSVAFSPDGETCLTGSWDKTACLWSSRTGELIAALKGHVHIINSVAYSPDGKTCLTGSADTRAIMWDSKTGERLITFKGHTRAIRSVTFTPNGEYCLTGSFDDTAALWNSKTGELLIIIKGERNPLFSPLDFSHEGEICLTKSCYSVAFNNHEEPYVTQINPAHTCIYAVAFSPNGELCSTASCDKTVSLWKIVYGFNDLTEKKKKRMLKRFITLYPLLQKTNDSTSDGSPQSCSSCLTQELQQEESAPFPCNSSELTTRETPTQRVTETEPEAVKERESGLDINSGAQKNCSIS